jgi:hypothetical protein
MHTVHELIEFLRAFDPNASVALKRSNHLHVGVLDFFQPERAEPPRYGPMTEEEKARHLALLDKFERYRIEEYACVYTGRLWYQVVHADTGKVADYYLQGRIPVPCHMFITRDEAANRLMKLP